jgi:putative peptidoglycan lipid II flippase
LRVGAVSSRAVSRDIPALAGKAVNDMSSVRRIISDSALTTVLTVVAKGLGFLVPVVVSALFGAGPATDAYFLAVAIPVMLIQVVGQALNLGMVPVTTRLYAQKPEMVPAYLGASCIFGSAVLGAFALLFYVGSGWLPSIVGFTENAPLLTLLCRYLAPLIIFVGLSRLWFGFFWARQMFTWPALSPGVKAVVLLAILLLIGKQMGIRALAWATIAGEATGLLFLVYGYRRAGGRLRVNVSWTPAHRETIIQTLPIAGSMAFFQLSPLVDRMMAAPLMTGSVSMLEYADRIYLIPFTLLGTGLLRVLLAHWSDDYARAGSPAPLVQSLHDVQGLVFFALIPLTFFVIAFRYNIVAALFLHGAFSSAAAVTTSQVLAILMLGYLPQAWWIILAQLLMALGRTRILLLVGLEAFVLNIILNFLLSRAIGVQGIALATAIVHCVNAAVVGAYVRRVVGCSPWRRGVGFGLVRNAAAVACAIAAAQVCVYAAGASSVAMQLVVAAGIASAAYLAVAALLQSPEMAQVIGIAKQLAGIRGGVVRNRS